jgi:hypothetical protein
VARPKNELSPITRDTSPWKSIETAPADGTFIEVLCADSSVHTARFCSTRYFDFDSASMGWHKKQIWRTLSNRIVTPVKWRYLR